MAEKSGLCACGHSYFDHLGYKYQEHAAVIREKVGPNDCERGTCVCHGYNEVGFITDARKFRGAPDPILNAGAMHPLTRSLRRYQEDGHTVDWGVLMCDRCYATDLEPSQVIPWQSYILCPDCFGDSMRDWAGHRLAG